jgi:hypothetical protein
MTDRDPGLTTRGVWIAVEQFEDPRFAKLLTVCEDPSVIWIAGCHDTLTVIVYPDQVRGMHIFLFDRAAITKGEGPLGYHIVEWQPNTENVSR